MKKFLSAAALISAIAVSFAGTSAQATATVTTATINLPVPITGTTSAVNSGSINTEPDDVCTPDEAGCQKGALVRVARCAYLIDQQAGTTNFQDSTAKTGKFGYVVAVGSGKTTFSLRSDPAGAADFDVAFYPDLGGFTCDGQDVKRGSPAGPIDHDGAATPCDPDSALQTSWAHFGNGTESGSIPSCFSIDEDGNHVPLPVKFAIVTLFGDHDKTFSLTLS